MERNRTKIILGGLLDKKELMFTFLHKKRGSKKYGFTLIEGLVLLFIFSVGVITLYKVFTLSMNYIIESKKRLAAVSLANQKMEILRNTPYTEIGLDGSTYATGFDYIGGTPGYLIPSGPLPNDSVETVNNLNFRVVYDMYYIDDPDDGTDAAGTDSISEDYKAVRVAVLWGAGITDASNTAQRIELSSYFIPPYGQEGVSGTHGALLVNVIDGAGAPVSGATVDVWSVSGGASVGTVVTSSDGHASFLTVSPGTNDYRVRVARGGAETIQTLEVQATLDPIYRDQSVWAGILTTITVVSADLQDFEIATITPFSESIADVDFDIYGGRIIGTDPSNGDAPVYTYSNTSVTSDATGIFDVGSDADIDGTGKASAGLYHVVLTESDFTFWRLEPSTFDDENIIDIPISDVITDNDVNMILLDDTKDGLFMRVTSDTAGNPPIEGAKVRVENIATSYDKELHTDQFGYVYHPEDLTSLLTNGLQYDVTVSATDYQDDTSYTPTINGLDTKTIELNTL